MVECYTMVDLSETVLATLVAMWQNILNTRGSHGQWNVLRESYNNFVYLLYILQKVILINLPKFFKPLS